MPGLRPIAVVTALCLALASWPAWARPVVLVWPGSGSGQADAPLDEAEALLRDDGVTVVPRASIRAALGPQRAAVAEQHERRRRAVEEALAQAQEAFLVLELERMAQILAGVEADAVALAGPGQCGSLWELQFRRGLAEWSLGRDAPEPPLDRYELALALDSSARPPGELYGPDVTAAFLDAVSRRSGRVPRPITFEVSPADAQVEIDCRAVSSTDSVELRPGLHAVTIRAPGYAPWSGVVDLRTEDVIARSLDVLPTERSAAERLAVSTTADPLPADSPSARAAVWALGHEHGAVAVLVVEQTSAGYAVRPWGREKIGVSVERATLSEALTTAMGLLDDEGRLVAPPPTAGDRAGEGPPDPGPSRKPVARTWWFWTIIGGVVVGGALGLGLGLGLRESTPSGGTLVIVAK